MTERGKKRPRLRVEPRPECGTRGLWVLPKQEVCGSKPAEGPDLSLRLWEPLRVDLGAQGLKQGDWCEVVAIRPSILFPQRDLLLGNSFAICRIIFP